MLLADSHCADTPSPVTKLGTLIPCPGGCGGEAELEPPLLVVRDGMERTVTPAVCKGGCPKTERRKSTGALLRLTPRFELETTAELHRSETPVVVVGRSSDDDRKRVEVAIERRGTSEFALATDLRLDLSQLRKYRKRGRGLSPAHIERLLAWALDETLDPAEESVESDDEKKEESEMIDMTAEDEDDRDTIRAAIEREGLTATAVAREYGLSQSAFSKWLRGHRTLSDARLAPVLTWANQVLDEAIASDASPPIYDQVEIRTAASPADEIVGAILRRAASQALEELAPEMVDRVQIDISLTWRAS